MLFSPLAELLFVYSFVSRLQVEFSLWTRYSNVAYGLYIMSFTLNVGRAFVFCHCVKANLLVGEYKFCMRNVQSWFCLNDCGMFVCYINILMRQVR